MTQDSHQTEPAEPADSAEPAAAAGTKPAKRRGGYPRPGKKGVRRWLPTWRFVLYSILLGGLALVLAFFAALLFVPVPTPNDIARAQVTTFYWDDGTTVLGRMGEANRTVVPLNQVSQAAQYAVLSAEDRTFYDHQGFSPTGFGRAVWNNIRGGNTQGGSTITQQYAKNAYLSQERSIARKAEELLLSIKLETSSSKDEILADYLNTVYYGRGAYGIEEASWAYFQVPARDLTAAQGAYLAALLQAPSSLSDPANSAALERRWKYVVDGMVTEGWLTQAERNSLTFPTPVAYVPPTNYYEGTNGYLFTAAQQQMYALGYTEDDLRIEGMSIITTFNQAAQEAALESVDAYEPNRNTEGLRIGLASITPATGAVVAMYAGADYAESQYNNATQARGQAGSTFKPFGLAAGLANDITLQTRYSGASPMTIQGYKIQNYGNASYGNVDMLYATEQSINTPYVQMNAKIGGEKTKAALIAAGIPADTPGLNDEITNVLGAASATPLEVATAYATLANRGQYVPPTMIKQVTSSTGAVLYLSSPRPIQAFSQADADRVTYALRRVVTNGTGTTAQGVGQPVAGKTGTSDDNMSAWFAGYSPQLATAVMMVKNDANGNNVTLSGTGGMSSVTGGSFPARIWTAYMRQTLSELPPKPFVEPSELRIPSELPSRTRSTSPSPSASPSASDSAVPSLTPTPTVEPSALFSQQATPVQQQPSPVLQPSP